MTPDNPADLIFDNGAVLYGPCLDRLKELPDCSVDAVVTDPPYGLADLPADKVAGVLAAWAAGDTSALPTGRGFMGKSWDAFVPPPAVWAECLRVLKPGGHLLAFAGSRTQDLMGISVRMAGFEIRDTLTWVYGSGFPKSLNVAAAVDKEEQKAAERAALLLPDEERFCAWVRDESGLTREQVGKHLGSERFFTGVVEVVNTATKERPRMGRRAMVPTYAAWDQALPHFPTVPPSWVTELVKDPPKPAIEHPSEWKSGKGAGTSGTGAWAGWGTALKPSQEPIIVARKPLGGTVAATVLEHGTGALNIDACRVGTTVETWPRSRSWAADGGPKPASATGEGRGDVQGTGKAPAGRWPANTLLTHATGCAQVGTRTAQLTKNTGVFTDQAQADGWGTKRPETTTTTTTEAVWACASRCPVAELDTQSGTSKSTDRPRVNAALEGQVYGQQTERVTGGHNDAGGASRFFPQLNWDPDFDDVAPFMYAAKPSRRERNAGVPEGTPGHPTVKPVAVMSWLIRLAVPAGGVVLDPFLGSGTTAVAAAREGAHFIGCEMTAEYLPIIAGRIAHAHGAATSPAASFRRRADALNPAGEQLPLFDTDVA